MKERNIAVDYVKFLAVILVMNSHMDICFTNFRQLSTGGIIGDALFFFASGFGLFLGRPVTNFFDWYKRRVRRIFPSVLAASIVAFLLFDFQESFIDVIICKRYWFICCILLYYILLYPVKCFGNGKYVLQTFFIWAAVCCIAFSFMSRGQRVFYGGGIGRILFFFLFMLIGAIMGKFYNRTKFKWWYAPASLCCIILWGFLCALGRGRWPYLISVIPFLGFTAFTYLTLSANVFKRIYESKIGGNIIWIVSQLCLECYLIQKFCYSDVLNFMFPLNIPIFMVVALAAAYLVRIVAEIILQTFDSNPYDWQKLILYKKE